jgi:hypothetical protein
MVDLITTIAGLLGLSVLEVKSRYNEYRNTRKESELAQALKARRSAAVQVCRDGLLKRAATEYYRRSIRAQQQVGFYSVHVRDRRVDTGTIVMPEWLDLRLPATEQTERSKFSYLAPPPPLYDEARIFAACELVELMQPRLQDAPIYRLIDVAFTAKHAENTFAKDSFLRYRFGAGLIIDELVDGLAKSRYRPAELLDRADSLLPLRNRALPDVASLLHFKDRVCAGGITMVFAVARPKPDRDFVIPLQRRSAIVADGQGMLTVVPRAFHQPSRSLYAEIRPSFSAYREIFEELFGGEETEAPVRRVRYDWFFSEEPMSWFRANPGSYELTYTCFGLDLVSGNYQFGFLMVIHDETFWDVYGQRMIENWEAEPYGPDPISTKNTAELERCVQDPTWTGEGLLTFVQGIRRLAERDPERVRIGTIRDQLSER